MSEPKADSGAQVPRISLLAFLQSEYDWAAANIVHERASGNATEVCWNRGYAVAVEMIAFYFGLPLNKGAT